MARTLRIVRRLQPGAGKGQQSGWSSGTLTWKVSHLVFSLLSVILVSLQCSHISVLLSLLRGYVILTDYVILSTYSIMCWV